MIFTVLFALFSIGLVLGSIVMTLSLFEEEPFAALLFLLFFDPMLWIIAAAPWLFGLQRTLS